MSSSMRAKFSCMSNEPSSDGETYVLKFLPVSSGSEENRDFFKYTPGGQIELYVVSPGVAGQIEVGHDYYVDFTKVEEK